jgi:hypothetical protein
MAGGKSCKMDDGCLKLCRKLVSKLVTGKNRTPFRKVERYGYEAGNVYLQPKEPFFESDVEQAAIVPLSFSVIKIRLLVQEYP